MHKLQILGSRGDDKFEWDVEVKEQVDVVAEVFAEKLLNGYYAFTVKEEKRELIRAFDPEAERIVMFPVISGGNR